MTTGVRERKKADTRRRLAALALDLASEHGVGGFTVADVAAAAGVAPRTFFNYFRTKEEALFRWGPDDLAAVTGALERRPPEESPVDALVAAFTTTSDPVSAVVQTWERRMRLIEQEPSLLAHHLAAVAEVEAHLAAAMARRLDAPDDDPFAVAVVGAVGGAVRAALAWWDERGRSVPLLDVLGVVIADLAQGFRR